jgi:hypothetical protein
MRASATLSVQSLPRRENHPDPVAVTPFDEPIAIVLHLERPAGTDWHGA